MTSSSGSADARLRVETIADSETTWIVIQGEADMSNVNQLDATLSGIQLDGSRFVRIEASGLAFFDVATLRCLTTFARTVKQTGREISTCGAPPVLHDVARILDLSDELGLS